MVQDYLKLTIFVLVTKLYANDMQTAKKKSTRKNIYKI